MRLSTILLSTGVLVYLGGLYGFTTFLPSYRESLTAEIRDLRYLGTEERAYEEQRLRRDHHRWESFLTPAFLTLMGAGMVVTGIGGALYLRDRRSRRDA